RARRNRATNLMRALFHGKLSSNVRSSERMSVIVRSPFGLATESLIAPNRSGVAKEYFRFDALRAMGPRRPLDSRKSAPQRIVPQDRVSGRPLDVPGYHH